MNSRNLLLGDELSALPTGKKLWTSKEYIKKRKQKIKDKCELCNETKDLVIHHKYKITDPVLRYYSLITCLIKKEKPDFAKSQVCPNCNSMAYYARQSINPTYRCSKCRYEFEDPKIDLVLNHLALLKKDPEKKKQYDQWITNRMPMIITRIRKDHLDAYNRYREMYDEDIQTLCKSCHYKETLKQENSFKPDPFLVSMMNELTPSN